MNKDAGKEDAGPLEIKQGKILEEETYNTGAALVILAD